MRGREGTVAASASQQGLSSKGSRAQTGQVGQQGGNHWTPAGGDSEGSFPAGRCRKGWVGLSPTEAGALEGPRGGELEADGLGDGVLGKGAGALPGSQGSGDGLCTAVRMGPGGLSEPAEAELLPAPRMPLPASRSWTVSQTLSRPRPLSPGS